MSLSASFCAMAMNAKPLISTVAATRFKINYLKVCASLDWGAVRSQVRILPSRALTSLINRGDEKSGVTSKSQNNANGASCVNSVTPEIVEILRKVKKVLKSGVKQQGL